jgi:uncharacterized protein (TIRG00374 family)
MKKTLLRTLLRISVSALLIFLLLRKTDFSAILMTMNNFSFINLLAAFLLFSFTFVILAYKWKILLPEYSLFLLIKTILIGHFYSTVLPGQIAGEAAKAYTLGKGKKNAEVIAASVLIDKTTGLLGLLIVGISGLFFSKTIIPQALTISLIIATFLVACILVLIQVKFVFSTILKILKYFKSVFPKAQKIFNQIELLIHAWRMYSKKSKILFYSVLFGILYQVVSIFTNMLLSDELNISVSFFDWSWIAAFLSFALLIPLSIGGIGIREGTLVGVLAVVGVIPENALALSFSLFGFTVIYAIVGGIVANSSMLKKIKVNGLIY